MNDMNQNDIRPDETEIHAYVDGQLDDARRTRMEAWLERHPDQAREIRGWRHDAQQLRAAFGDLPPSTGQTALDPALIRTRRRHRTRTHLALAAALVLALGVGGLGGWQMHGASMPTAAAPMADAVHAYRMFATNRHVKLDMIQQHPGDLQAWLDRHFRDAAPLPQLDGSGFHPVGGRLMATDSGPAAMVLYENSRGNAISFYIRPPSARTGPLPHGQRREGALAATYWSGHGYNYALISPADASDMRAMQAASRSVSS